MSQLRNPGLGPIVGHTTDHSARVWIRGEDNSEHGANINADRRTVGIVGITKINGVIVKKPVLYYFRLRREYDRTGTFTLGEETGLQDKGSPSPLIPATLYEARIGTLSVDDPRPLDDSISSEELGKRLPDADVWRTDLVALDPEFSQATFKTFPKPTTNPTADFSFMLGSCRYPGLLWQAKHSDAIFGPLLKEAQRSNDAGPASFVLMVGDQIYADMLNRHVPIGLADTFEEFQERYHSAFGSTFMRQLLRNITHYMILDDHEIADNWSQDRIKKAENRRVFNVAINAYMSYQWVHGPTKFGKRLYYDFEFGGYPFFVLDTRTQRFMDDVPNSLEDNNLLGRHGLTTAEPGQIDLLLKWLVAAQKRVGDAPKFIVTSSVFVPNPIGAREGRKAQSDEQSVKWKEDSDSWPAFPTTRKALLKTIISNKIQNVVFLSGDIHCSNVAEMMFSDGNKDLNLKAFSITSSAFYWPFPFADGEPSNFVHNSKEKGQEDTFDIDGKFKMDYVAKNFTQENNYCRINVDRKNHEIVVVPYDTDGDVILQGSWLGTGGRKIVSKLSLAKW